MSYPSQAELARTTTNVLLCFDENRLAQILEIKKQALRRGIDLRNEDNWCDDIRAHVQEIRKMIATVVKTDLEESTPGDVETIPLAVFRLSQSGPSKATKIHREFVGKNIKRLRERKGWSITELANQAKLHRPHLSDLEAGNHAATHKTLSKIAKALGVCISHVDLSYNAIGREIERHRLSRKWSTLTLAESIGMPVSVIEEIESGTTLPFDSELRHIAAALEINPKLLDPSIDDQEPLNTPCN